MDSSFSPSIPCKKTTSNARRMLFMIRRSFAELSAPAFAAPYNALVRLHLGYAMQACSPNLVADADCLEQIQQLVTRLVKGFRRLPNEERLRRLGLHSLRRRRLRGDLIVLYKMVSGGLGLDSRLFSFITSGAWLERSSFQSSAGSWSAPSKRIVLFNASRKILEQTPHSDCYRPFREFLQEST